MGTSKKCGNWKFGKVKTRIMIGTITMDIRESQKLIDFMFICNSKFLALLRNIERNILLVKYCVIKITIVTKEVENLKWQPIVRGWVECIKILSNVDIEEWRTSMQGQLKQQQLRFEEKFHVHLKQSDQDWKRNKSQFTNG